MNDAARQKANRATPWHPIPTILIDGVMPGLRDTELRLMLVVLRQTWGWKPDREEADNRFKRRDWLSHSQLCWRTGRGSDAVSGAVASLAASGLIVVEDASGRPLTTPGERRRHLGRLYFRPGEIWSDVEKWKTGDPSRPGKPGTTTERLQQ